MNKPYSFLLAACLLLSLPAAALDHPGLAERRSAPGRFPLVEKGVPAAVVTDPADRRGVLIAAETLREDFARVCGVKAPAQGARVLYAGTKDSPLIKRLAAEGRIDTTPLNGQYETYILQVTGDAVIIAGADMRGTIYGIYEISEQLGVSPWYDWADVPVPHGTDISLAAGTYTVPQPGVRYRGIFLNDEAPCLTSWVKNTYGTDYGDHRFYARVFELLLRLRANFMWPAMWGWAFYADDPENSRTADEMGIIMGTSHHEPMARNHQEWARRRGSSGPWDYTANKKVLTQFFTEGIERAKDTEDLITIGMRGDGDASLGKLGEEAAYIKLLETIIKDQRKIIRKVTGKPAEQRPQVWALYKEVQQYYDLGLRVPDDVTILLSDDNWGDVRKLPTAAERARKGGWGLYYHVVAECHAHPEHVGAAPAHLGLRRGQDLGPERGRPQADGISHRPVPRDGAESRSDYGGEPAGAHARLLRGGLRRRPGRRGRAHPQPVLQVQRPHDGGNDGRRLPGTHPLPRPGPRQYL